MLKLNDDDSRAVDLYLETRAHPAGATVTSPVSAARVRTRLTAVESILETLSEFPAEEPPANLVAKTLAAVEARRLEAPKLVPADRQTAGTRVHA